MNVVERIIQGVKARGLYFVVYLPRELVLKVPADKKSEVTDAMKNAIKAFKEEIIVHENLTPIPKPEIAPVVVKEEYTQEQEDRWNAEIDAAIREIEARIGPHPSPTPFIPWPKRQ